MNIENRQALKFGKCKSSCCEDSQSFILWLKVLFSVALRTVPVQLSPSPDAGGGERERGRDGGREGEERERREEGREKRRGTEEKEGRREREEKYHIKTVKYNSILCKLFCTSCKFCANYYFTIYTQ